MSTTSDITIDPEVLVGFLEESREALASLDSLFIELEKHPDDANIINSIFRPVHSIKGNAPFFGLLRLKTLAHEFESLLAVLRGKQIQPSRELFSLLLAGIDEIKAVLSRVGSGQPEVADEAHFNTLIDRAKAAASGKLAASAAGSSLKLREIREILDSMNTWNLPDSQIVEIQKLRALLDESTSSASPAAKLPETPPTSPGTSVAPKESPQKVTPQKDESSKSMRVPVERIDTFLRFVGELIIAQDMIRHFTSRMEHSHLGSPLIRELATINGVMSSLGTGLEKAIMSIRKVPVRSLLQKAPRLIRDVAAAKGKEIEVRIVGEDTEIDKSLVELLDAPITHMARNAADHGIETPAIREAAGKNRKGTVSISCEETPKDILITISDDGAGLNYEGLTKKARSLGMISSGESLSEAQIVNLIFMAGVSTAQEVSDISGRGVGMDVVKRNIEAAGGLISVTSVPGKGCTFALKLPKSVTTQIIQGFVVVVGGTNFVLPVEKVHESWFLKSDEVTHVAQNGPCISRHDSILPIVDLGEFLGAGPQKEDQLEHLVVTIDVNEKQLALYVDDVIGPRQLVLKPLEDIANQSKLFLGGALLGNGEVALVLDVGRIVH